MIPSIDPLPIPVVSNLRTTATVIPIKVVGGKFMGLDKLSDLMGSTIQLVPEPDNPVDPNAILVLEDGIKIGYVSRKCLAPLHTLLGEHLTHLRKQQAYHVDEMACPMILNNVSRGDDGKPYGEILVVGLNQMGAEDLGVTAEPRDQVPRKSEWRITVRNGGSARTRVVRYEVPVSRAMVENYCSNTYPDSEVIIDV